MKQINLSICIPVYNTEKYLSRCLNSLLKQDFDSFEIVIINDCSPGKDENNNNCKKIVKKFIKSTKIPVNYIENSNNLGTLETRRIAVYESKGDFIFFLDSDDYLEENCISKLYETAISTDSDIVQGILKSGTIENEKFIQSRTKKLEQLYSERLENHDIFCKSFMQNQITANLCSKLIKKDLFLYAFEQIPFTYCNFAEDFLIFFFISLKAKSYIGIPITTYYYIIDTGITSISIINNIQDFQKKCTVSSVFSIIQLWLNTNPILTEDEILYLKYHSTKYLQNNIKILEKLVTPELKKQGYDVLCDYWGKNLVDKTKIQFESK